MTNLTSFLCMFCITTAIPCTYAFQTASQVLPMRIDPIPTQEIIQRLGLKENTNSNTNNNLSIGSSPNMKYKLFNEHEVICPASGSHRGILCTAMLSSSSMNSDESYDDDANSIANNHELVSQAILAGSLAASVRNSNPDSNSIYHLPYVITLVESLMADEMNSIDLSKMVFNSGGLETNEILMDWNDNYYVEEGRSIVMFAVNTASDRTSASSDIYLLPSNNEGKVWRFNVEYKVCTINLNQIYSFGDRDSTTPLKPDVWLKDDYY